MTSMERQSVGGVHRLSPEMDSIIAPGARVEVLAEGFDWAEGPVWVEAGGYLLFTDVPQNVIWRWSETGGLSEFMRPSGFDGEDGSHLREPGANGLVIEPAGTLLMCDHGNRSLSRVDLATREKTIVVDRFEGRRFNSPNDLVIHRSGAVYFTDPPYGLEGMNESPVKELAHNGLYRMAPHGAVRPSPKRVLARRGVRDRAARVPPPGRRESRRPHARHSTASATPDPGGGSRGRSSPRAC